MNYAAFVEAKGHTRAGDGYEPVWMPEQAFPFQRSMVEWGLRRGRGLLAEDCGLGKTLQGLAWAENLVRITGGRVLILTPLAVAAQTIREGEKFGVEVRRSSDGAAHAGVTVSNYERLHHFSPSDFVGVVCDESSAIKAFDGKRRAQVTDFLRRVRFRLLGTATAAPNDYTELGTSSEALGELGYVDMLNRFFKNEQANSSTKRGYLGAANHWRLKGHASVPFWRWVCSWARALRKPSDIGFEDDGFALPELVEREHVVEARTLAAGALFPLPATNMQEEREERRRTIAERCELAAALVNNTGEPAVIWCHLNAEGDLLAKLVSDGRQVSGQDSDDAKEQAYEDFSAGRLRVLIIKPRIGAWGLNWQHCAHVVTFADHSYEQYYQAVRRCWRFGQKRPVVVDLIATEGERGMRENLRRKAAAADQMFAELVIHMNAAQGLTRRQAPTHALEVPRWL